ncbi:MAG TPA: c-type cytochrome [Verrucomicrobiae bacterium]
MQVTGMVKFLASLLGIALAASAFSASPEDEQRTATAVEALSRLQGVDINQSPKLKETVLKLLEKTRGTPNFLKLVEQFKIKDQDEGLLDLAAKNSTNETGVQAMRLILQNNDLPLVEKSLQTGDSNAHLRIVEALANSAEKETNPVLLPLVTDMKRDLILRKQAVHGLLQNEDGAKNVVALAKENKLPPDLKLYAGAELSRVRWANIKQQAAELLPPPAGRNSQPLPPISELTKLKGDAANGAKLFLNPAVGCSTCHQVRGQGVDFGPNLSEIGSKLGKDALYEAILEPSAGISFGFEAWQLKLKSGDEPFGIIVSDSVDEIALKAVGGLVTRYKKSEVLQREQMKQSIMPIGLQQSMTTEELVDLVEYLSSLKKTSP